MLNFPDRALIDCIDLEYQKLSGEFLPGPKKLTVRNWWLHQSRHIEYWPTTLITTHILFMLTSVR